MSEQTGVSTRSTKPLKASAAAARLNVDIDDLSPAPTTVPTKWSRTPMTRTCIC
jgi:hypothetical protein